MPDETSISDKKIAQESTLFLTSLLGCTPLTFTDDIVNRFTDPIQPMLSYIQEFLEAYSVPDLHNGVHLLETLLFHLINKNTDKLITYLLTEILVVKPQGVIPVIPEIRKMGKVEPEPSDWIEAWESESNALRDEICQMKILNQKLSTRNEQLNRKMALIQAKSQAVPTISESTLFTSSQLPAYFDSLFNLTIQVTELTAAPKSLIHEEFRPVREIVNKDILSLRNELESLNQQGT